MVLSKFDFVTIQVILIYVVEDFVEDQYLVSYRRVYEKYWLVGGK